MELRSYQKEAVQSLHASMKQGENGLCVLPTGTGKTCIMCEFLKQCQQMLPDLKAIVLMKSVELVDQTSQRLINYGINNCGVYCASLKSKKLTNITVASIQSINKIETGAVNLLIIDEVHAYNHSEGKYLEFVKKLKELRSQMKVIGFSATPFRANGYIYGKDKLFPRIAYTKSISWMIENNYLVKPVLKSVDHKFNTAGLHIQLGDYKIKELEALCEDAVKINQQINDAMPRLIGRKKVVWFCVSIRHAEMVNQLLQYKGETSCTIHSKIKEGRDDLFETFSKCFDIRHLANVSIIVEGIDIPSIDAIVLMCPTRSANKYLQSVGRGLRPYGDKKDCLVLDYGDVVRELGSLEDPLLIFKNKGKGLKGQESLKVCPECFSYIHTKLKNCPDCGYKYPDVIPLDKVGTKAAEEGSLLGSASKNYKTLKVHAVKTYDYVSKSGNECYVIEYIDNSNIFADNHKEYFVKTNDYAVNNYNKRLKELEELPSPFEIELIRDGKYWRMSRIKKEVKHAEWFEAEKDIPW